jgi:hypothetical protein
MSEADVMLAWREIVDSKGAASRYYFTMLNCFLEKRKRMAFLAKHFNSPLVICHATFFADKNKFNSVHLS